MMTKLLQKRWCRYKEQKFFQWSNQFQYFAPGLGSSLLRGFPCPRPESWRGPTCGSCRVPRPAMIASSIDPLSSKLLRLENTKVIDRSLCRVFLKQMHGLFFCIFVFSTVDIKYEKYMKILLMTGCEPWYHGIGSDSSANWATTIAPINCADLKQICQQGSKDWPAPTSPVPRRKSSSLGSWWHFRKASAT